MLDLFGFAFCDLGRPQVVGGRKESRREKAFCFNINKGTSRDAPAQLQKSTNSKCFLLGVRMPYLLQLRFCVGWVRMQHTSWILVLCLALDPPGCPNHQIISGWPQCSSKPMFVHHHGRRCLSPCCAVCFEGALSSEENPLFDVFFGRPHCAHAPAKTKTDYTIWGEAGGRTPADLHLPFHGFVRCPVLHRELHHCQAGLRQTSPRLDYIFHLLLLRTITAQKLDEISLQVVLFLVSLSLCIGFSGDFPGGTHPWTGYGIASNCRGDYFTFQLIQNILCFASGLINALCIFDMGMTVSHQSGNTSHTGRLIMIPGVAKLLICFYRNTWLIHKYFCNKLKGTYSSFEELCGQSGRKLVLLWIPRLLLKGGSPNFRCSVTCTLALMVYH